MTGISRQDLHPSLILTLLAAFLVGLVVTAPATLIVPKGQSAQPRLSYTGVYGTIWHGRAVAVTLSETLIGDIEFETRPLSGAWWGPNLQWTSSNGAVNGEGQMSIGLRPGAHFSAQNVTLSLDTLPLQFPLTGSLSVSNLEVVSGADGCLSAQGFVVLAGMASAPLNAAVSLAGDVQCSGGKLVVIATGDTSGMPMSVHLQQVANNEASTLITVEAVTMPQRSALALLGFKETDTGFEFSQNVRISD